MTEVIQSDIVAGTVTNADESATLNGSTHNTNGTDAKGKAKARPVRQAPSPEKKQRKPEWAYVEHTVITNSEGRVLTSDDIANYPVDSSVDLGSLDGNLIWHLSAKPQPDRRWVEVDASLTNRTELDGINIHPGTEEEINDRKLKVVDRMGDFGPVSSMLKHNSGRMLWRKGAKYKITEPNSGGQSTVTQEADYPTTIFGVLTTDQFDFQLPIDNLYRKLENTLHKATANSLRTHEVIDAPGSIISDRKADMTRLVGQMITNEKVQPLISNPV